MRRLLLNMPERLFNAAGVRAVMVFPFSTQLMPGAQTSVWVTVSSEGRVPDMANINVLTRRKQTALLVAVALGLSAIGGVARYIGSPSKRLPGKASRKNRYRI